MNSSLLVEATGRVPSTAQGSSQKECQIDMIKVGLTWSVERVYPMAADFIIYCLEHVTDYDQFERLCHDMMALDGYRGIEPLGGSKDKGRDAIHIDRTSNDKVTIFAYTVREDWRKKLAEDSQKVQKHGHTCQRFAFLCSADFTASERDEAVNYIRTTFGWTLELYGRERLRTMLCTTHGLAHHRLFPDARILRLSEGDFRHERSVLGH
jgi:hypothetical protein